MNRQCCYNRTPGQTRNCGVARLVYPFQQIWSLVETRFLLAVFRALFKRGSDHDVETLLEEHEFLGTTIRLQPFFGHIEDPPEIREPFDVPGLERLIQLAEDLADDEGSWRSRRDEMADASRAVVSEIPVRMQRMFSNILADHGPRTARKVADHLRQALHAQIDQCQRDLPPWTPDRSAQLRSYVAELRGLSKPRSRFWKIVIKWRPATLLRRWLSVSQQRRLAQGLEAIRFAAQIRYRRDLDRYRIATMKQLASDYLEKSLHVVQQYEEFFQGLAEGVQQRSTEDHAVVPPADWLVSNLDTVIDQRSGITLKDLYARSLATAGCTAERFVETLLSQGVPVGNQDLRPAQLLELDQKTACDAIVARVQQYLGSDDPKKKLNVDNPATAFEHAATINLGHPALRQLIKSRIPDLARRSSPYGQFRSVHGATPSVFRYLFCYTPHRPMWEQLLANHALPVPAKEQTCSVRHPFEIILYQAAFGHAGHAQPSYLRGRYVISKGHPATQQPLFDSANAQELRLLTSRPDDHEDVSQLTDALIKAKAVRSIGNARPPRYALARPEPSVEHYFAAKVITSVWQTPKFFRKQISTSRFKALVEVHYPNVRDWNDLAFRLQHDPSAEHVAGELERHNILESDESGLFRMTGTQPADITALPAGLYRQKRGRLVGLTKKRLARALRDDDWLYNVMFWRVVDAFAAGQLLRHDVPPFLVEYVDTHLK